MCLYELKDLGNVNAVLVRGHLAHQFRNVYLKILSELFKDRYVELRIFVTLAHRISQKDGFADKFDRNKYDRSIVRIRLVLLIPLEETDSQVKRAGAVFFDGRFCSPVKLLYLGVQIR